MLISEMQQTKGWRNVATSDRRHQRKNICTRMEIMKRRQPGEDLERSPLGSERSKCKGLVVLEPNFLVLQRRDGHCSERVVRAKLELRGRSKESLWVLVKSKNVILRPRQGYLGVSITHYLLCSLLFTLTLLYSQSLLLIFNTLCISNISYKTIELLNLILPQSNAFQFLGSLLGKGSLFLWWENVSIRKWFCLRQNLLEYIYSLKMVSVCTNLIMS